MANITNIHSLESQKNSTNIPLLAGTTFTGETEFTHIQDVMVTMIADQNGTLFVEFSTDGTNWDTSLEFNYNTTRINPPHIFVKGERYFRVRFVNTSASDQTFIRLCTTYSSFNRLTAPLNGMLAENYDALPTRPTSFEHEVAIGKRQGSATWNKFAYNDDIDTGAQEVIASWGGTYVPPVVAETIDIISTSIEDILTTGTGLQKIVITGIDANREEQIEEVEMNGTTTVTTTSTWLGINKVSPVLCGSTRRNVGIIGITNTISGQTLSEMPENGTTTQQAILHVKANYTLLLTWLHINVVRTGGGVTPVVTVRGHVYDPITNADIQIFKVRFDTEGGNNNIDIVPKEPFPVTEGSVLYFTAETDKNNTSVDIGFSGQEQRNN